MDLTQSRQPQMYASALVTYAFAIIAVTLRFTARRLKHTELWWDDWLILVGLIILTGFIADFIIWIHYGFGRHYETLDSSFLKYYFICFFASEMLYTSIICVVKYSILAFYWRIFSRSSIRLPIWILVGIVSCWGFAVLVASILSCIPIQGLWDKNINAKCHLNDRKFLIGISVANMTTDIVLLILPIPYILWLNATKEQKLLLCGMFLLGSLACMASIFRLYYLATTNVASADVSWNSSLAVLWSSIELNMAVLSACLPSLRPIYSLVTTGSINKSNLHHNTHGDHPSSPSTPCKKTLLGSIDIGSHHPFTVLHEGQNTDIQANAPLNEEAWGDLGDADELRELEPVEKGIRVRRDVHVSIV